MYYIVSYLTFRNSIWDVDKLGELCIDGVSCHDGHTTCKNLLQVV